MFNSGHNDDEVAALTRMSTGHSFLSSSRRKNDYRGKYCLKDRTVSKSNISSSTVRFSSFSFPFSTKYAYLLLKTLCSKNI